MSTAHSQIATALKDALLQEPAIADGAVYRSRTRAINKDTRRAVVVRISRSASTLAAVIGGPTTWQTLVGIECYGRGSGDQLDEAADQLVAQVFERLAQMPTLGGQALDVLPLEGDTLAWDHDEFDTGLTCITAQFVITHQTYGRTLSQ
ncbi:hypothetical protein [Pseudoduganella albidiflava]|uniref:DUF3168 domain-containing protein n=1 Tax=Pseudoduganella albidiflava TaxID=321983 RepID=A0A411X2R9_9BURK|nr:hypothetical protein [Pseudoduganella albidiflava]QBI03290.1 hypothetical protein EYF70_22520 [Pseudoduganella albidiflava]GGY68042.1 hypothetical protein GCM10007387_57780 [Pseudoduganella albidiflava]